MRKIDIFGILKRNIYTHQLLETHTSALNEKLLDILRDADLVPASVLSSLIERSEGDTDTFKKLLLSEGHLSDSQLGQVIANIHGWKCIDLRRRAVPGELQQTLPSSFAARYEVIPYSNEDGVLRFATTNPDNGAMIRLLRKRFGSSIDVYYATPSMVRSKLTGYEQDIEKKFEELVQSHRKAEISRAADDRSVIKLLDTLVTHGIRKNASDIHIEPSKDSVLIRERIDGILHKTIRISPDIHRLLTLRIKILSNLEIDEHDKPQDGKFHYDEIDGKYADIRVSVIPTTHGEKIVLRLLVTQESALPISSLGMRAEDEDIVNNEIQRAWGTVLVTGPTGSGKTTTLYAVLRKLQSDDTNISTIEDPVEYDLPGINQIQVHEKAGLTFAEGLRAMLRQDPNVLLVGEIRDQETASIAVNAALTGHLVLSTLHTNDAATTIPRLLDMGIEPFLISSTINMIVAQRLVRTICPSCKQSIDISRKDLHDSLPKEMGKALFGSKKTIRLYQGKGCEVCNHSGFRGRMGIFEILQMTDELRALITKGADSKQIMHTARKLGMRSMLEDGIVKVREGATTVEEVLRVIRA